MKDKVCLVEIRHMFFTENELDFFIGIMAISSPSGIPSQCEGQSLPGRTKLHVLYQTGTGLLQLDKGHLVSIRDAFTYEGQSLPGRTKAHVLYQKGTGLLKWDEGHLVSIRDTFTV
jgi:hypothetical protein